MPSFPALKKWQLLLFVLTASIVGFMVITFLSAIYTPSTTTITTTTFVPSVVNVTCYENFTDYSVLRGKYYATYHGWGINDLFQWNIVTAPTAPEGNTSLACWNNTIDGTPKWFESSNLDANYGAVYPSTCPEVLGFWIRTYHDENPYANSDIKVFDRVNGYYFGMRFEYASTDQTYVSGIIDNSVGYHAYTLTAGNWYWCETMIYFSGGSFISDMYINGTGIGGTAVGHSFDTNCTIQIGRTTGSVQAAYYDYVRMSNSREFPPTYAHYETTVTTIINNDLIGEAQVLMTIGLVGAMLDIVTPVYVIETFMDGNYIEALGFGFMGFLLGTAFIIAWLW
jgi:glutaredoxin-related protein